MGTDPSFLMALTPFALDPALNVRVCYAGGPEPCGPFSPDQASEFVRAVEFDLPDSDATERVLHAVSAPLHARRKGERLRVSGSGPELQAWCERLKSDAGLLAGVGREVAAALAAFEATRCRSDKTLVMGILNVTPDSFSDGGLWIDPGAAVEHALRMVADGADILDVGGESTRPGAAEIPVGEELRRVLPVIKRLRAETTVLLSVDTRKADVAEQCLDAGAHWVNDVSGLAFDPRMADVVAARPEARLVLMHSLAPPREERYSTEYTPGNGPVYDDVIVETTRWLRQQAQTALARGVAPEQLWIDPGFGFSKNFSQNVELLRRLREYTSLGPPVLVGTSRKSSVGRLVGDLPPSERGEATLATTVWSVAHGAAAVRVHEVKENARAARAADILRGWSPGSPKSEG